LINSNSGYTVINNVPAAPEPQISPAKDSADLANFATSQAKNISSLMNLNHGLTKFDP
jgi:hypothetical protein